VNQVEIERSGEPCLWEMTYEQADPECKHPLPGDWEFAGATGEDPRADPRWQPETFSYLDRMLHRITITQVPRCIHEAIGSHKTLVERRTDRKVFYVTGGLPDEKAEIIYSDPEGAFSAS
jgi:hypothetical protein